MLNLHPYAAGEIVDATGGDDTADAHSTRDRPGALHARPTWRTSRATDLVDSVRDRPGGLRARPTWRAPRGRSTWPVAPAPLRHAGSAAAGRRRPGSERPRRSSASLPTCPCRAARWRPTAPA